MSIQETKEQYSKGAITKAGFIDAMYQYHSVLSDFAATLQHTEIEKIEITDGSIIMSSRETPYHVGGVKFITDIQDKRTVTLEAFNFNTYEREDSEMIYKLISPDSHIIDIGANIGWYTIHIASMLKNGTIHCFEPIPETFDKLNANISINGLRNIKANRIALSEKQQQLTFYYNPKQTGASSSQNITGNTEVVKLELESITLDEYTSANNIGQIDFIKCDVEGAELFVFQGAQQALAKHKPVVFTEMLRKWSAQFGYHPNDIISLFAALGYTAYYVEEGQFIRIDTVTEDTAATNFFFLHSEKHHHIISELCKRN